MTDVRVRYLSGDESTFPNMPTLRHLQVAVAAHQDQFAPDVLLLTDNGVQLAATEPPPEQVIAITQIADENTRRWIDILHTHAFADDQEGVSRALDALSKTERTREDVVSLCTVSFVDILFDGARPEGQLGGLELLLRSKADCNDDSYIQGHQCALLAAVKKGNHAIVKELIEVCKDQLQPNKATVGIRMRPLSEACAHGFEDIVQTLLLAHADTNSRDAFGRTALHAAATGGYSKICAALLRANAVLDSKDTSHRTALACACASGHASTVSLLVSAGADPLSRSPTGSTAIMDALAHNYPALVDVFMSLKCATVRQKLATTADMTGSTPLHVAAANGHAGILKPLIEAGCPINARDCCGRTALYRAAWNGRAHAAMSLVSCKADTNITDKLRWGPLHAAATNGHALVLMQLMRLGLNIEMMDEALCTALVLAARAGSTQCVRALVNAEANMESKDHQGCTALYRAAWSGREDCVLVLLANGANPNIRCKSTGSTPLHGAAWQGLGGLVSMLLQYNADADAVDQNGATALCEAQDFEVLALLVAARKSRRRNAV